MTDLEFQTVNEERIRLIDKKYEGPPMTQSEMELLERLQEQVSEYLENKFGPSYTKKPDGSEPRGDGQQEPQP